MSESGYRFLSAIAWGSGSTSYDENVSAVVINRRYLIQDNTLN